MQLIANVALWGHAVKCRVFESSRYVCCMCPTVPASSRTLCGFKLQRTLTSSSDSKTLLCKVQLSGTLLHPA